MIVVTNTINGTICNNNNTNKIEIFNILQYFFLAPWLTVIVELLIQQQVNINFFVYI